MLTPFCHILCQTFRKTETTLLGPLLQPGMWKRKRLIFCGSGSTLMEEVGSGSESVENELEAEAIFSKSGAPEFSNSETGYHRWGNM